LPCWKYQYQGGPAFEDLVDVRGVCYCCLIGNTSTRVDLLEDLVDVQRVCLFSILAVLTLAGETENRWIDYEYTDVQTMP
jgi:hypothetical protein